MTDGDDTTFEAPGPGFWELDRSHHDGGTSPIIKKLMKESTEAAFVKQFADFGLPAETMSIGWSNGFLYRRLRPLIRPDNPSSKAPPTLILKILVRLHPEMRRRNRRALQTLADKPWREEVKRWDSELRPVLEAQNLAYQRVEPAELDNDELAAHVESLIAHCAINYEEHFRLHGFDLGPIGLLLDFTNRHGLDPMTVASALVGASPTTSGPAEALAEIRARVKASGEAPDTLDGLRALDDDVAELLDGYLEHHQWIIYSSYDIDGLTLAESPDVLLSTILTDRSTTSARPESAAAIADELRSHLDAAERDEFDELLADARLVMDLRDDNGPNTVEWPTGLLRRGMLEVGRRLAEAGSVAKRDHVFDLHRTEVGPLLVGAQGPTAEELASRHSKRMAEKELDPPPSIGRPEAVPPIEALPTGLARMVGLITSVMEQMGMAAAADNLDAEEALAGVGIGSVSVAGRARVASSPEEAIASLEPGDILVTRTTTPAYNLVLTLVAGLVTAEGGPICHAAVLSRELGIPAVIGVRGSLDLIPDGAMIEVDPSSNRVTILASQT